MTAARSVGTVYLNGQWLPQSEARVSALDRGFLFGDGVYEVVPAYGGRLFRLDPHLDRLDRSLAAIRIPNPLSRAEWYTVLNELLARDGGGDRSVYLQVTRGAAEKRDHAFPDPAVVTPTVFAMTSPIAPARPPAQEAGVAAVTCEDIRWGRCDIKAITLLANILLRQSAVDAGAFEAILIRNGVATEGAASNLFAVLDGQVVTPPADERLLPGITRDLVLELAQRHDVPCTERALPEAELRRADEVWLTSSTREIVPVIRLDDAPVGEGRPGPVWHTMARHFQAYRERLRRGEDTA